jgi:hypothetical protein
MRIRAGERDSRAFPLSMQKMDGTSTGDAAMHRYIQRQHFFLFGREISIERRKLDPELKSSSSNNTVHHNYRSTR